MAEDSGSGQVVAPAPAGETTPPDTSKISASRRVRAQRSLVNPVLEPRVAVHRQFHPKADLAILQRAYDVAEERHADQLRRSGDPYITHPLAVANILALHPEITKLRVEGHTDDVGNDKFNQKLSEKRALAVMQHLIKKNGIAKERLESVGYGRTKPLSDLKTDEARAANRRVEFIVVVRAATP